MIRFPLPGLAALAAAVCALACAGLPRAPAVLDASFPGGRTRSELSALAGRARLAPGASFVAVEIGRDAHTSHHVVAIRDRETPHRHDRHDLLVVMLRGHGRWRVAGAVHEVGEGSILYVPRGSVHAFANESDSPAIAYAMYTPAFDARDRTDAE